MRAAFLFLTLAMGCATSQPTPPGHVAVISPAKRTSGGETLSMIVEIVSGEPSERSSSPAALTMRVHKEGDFHRIRYLSHSPVRSGRYVQSVVSPATTAARG